MSDAPTSNISAGDTVEPLQQAAIALSPHEFIEALAQKMAAADPHIIAFISRYAERVQHYGSDDNFKSADMRQFLFLKKIMHIGGGELNDEGEPYTRAKLSMIENLTRNIIETAIHRYAKDFYITYPLESLKEIQQQCENIFKEYPEFTMKDGVMDNDCKGILNTIQTCAAFVEEQHRLLGMDTRGKQ